MKPTTIVGILLILAGIFCFAYGGIAYDTEEQVAQVGNVQVTAETENVIPLPPVLGGLCLAIGIGLVLVDRFKKR